MRQKTNSSCFGRAIENILLVEVWIRIPELPACMLWCKGLLSRLSHLSHSRGGGYVCKILRESARGSTWRTLPAIKMKARRNVAGRGENCPLCDPGSEIRSYESETLGVNRLVV